jgi:type IV pilus assembly protein PilY1
VDYYARYKDRRNIVVAGANDGMLHAFNAGFFMNGDTTATPGQDEAWYDPRGVPLGEELWGWIPFNSLPHLKWLKEPDYCHVFYVDLAPRILDLPIYLPDADHPNGWGTTLVGGMGLGCKTTTVGATTFRSSIFILDITNPDSPSFPKPIFEYNDPGLGYTTSQPIVARVNTASGQDYWYIIFGSGPTTFDYTSSQPAKLYVLNLDGANSRVLALPGSANEFLGRGVAVDVDNNYNVDVIYIASTIGSGPFTGKIYRIVTRANPGDPYPDPNPANWRISVLYSGNAPFSTGPRFALDDAGNKWVYIGTGRYFSTADKTDTSTQYFLAIKDPCWDGSCTTTFTLANLYQIAQSCVLQSSGTTTGCGLTPQQIASNVASKQGWYIQFTGGERVVTRSVVSNKAVFFTTFTPINSPCSGGGTSRLWSASYNSGVILAPPQDLGVGVAQIAKTTRGLITQLSTGALGQPSTGLMESDTLTGLDILTHPFLPPAVSP